MKTHTKLTAVERDKLALWKARHVSNKECARRLGRQSSTIGRELKRNSLKDEYVAIHAQQNFLDRQRRVVTSKHPLKNADIYAYVTARLRDGWSPDQIAGKLKKDHSEHQHWWITAETIYRWIYQPEQANRDNPWSQYLRRKQKKRKKYNGRKVHRSHISDRVSIHKRDEVITSGNSLATGKETR